MAQSDGWFKTGNPGRPTGSRNRLSEAFLKALADDFEAHGVETLVATRKQRPSDYIRVIASLLPRDKRLELDVNSLSLIDVLTNLPSDRSALEVAQPPAFIEVSKRKEVSQK